MRLRDGVDADVVDLLALALAVAGRDPREGCDGDECAEDDLAFHGHSVTPRVRRRKGTDVGPGYSPRLPSSDSLPAPRAAMNRNRKQYSTAASP